MKKDPVFANQDVTLYYVNYIWKSFFVFKFKHSLILYFMKYYMLYQTDLRCKMKRYSRSINIYFSFKQFLIDLTYSFQFKENILKYFNFLLTLKSLNLYRSIHLIFIVLFHKKKIRWYIDRISSFEGRYYWCDCSKSEILFIERAILRGSNEENVLRVTTIGRFISVSGAI